MIGEDVVGIDSILVSGLPLDSEILADSEFASKRASGKSEAVLDVVSERVFERFCGVGDGFRERGLSGLEFLLKFLVVFLDVLRDVLRSQGERSGKRLSHFTDRFDFLVLSQIRAFEDLDIAGSESVDDISQIVSQRSDGFGAGKDSTGEKEDEDEKEGERKFSEKLVERLGVESLFFFVSFVDEVKEESNEEEE